MGEGVGAVADKEVLVEQPDVGFHAGAAPAESIVEWYTAPVVIVRVARDGSNILGDIKQVGSHVSGGLVRAGPVQCKSGRVIVECGEIAQKDIDNVYAATESVSKLFM